MKKSRIILLLVSAVIIIVVCFSWYIGLFTSIKIEDKEEGGYKVVGKEFTGSYSKVGKLIMNVDKKLSDLGVMSMKGFGIYYDDPKIVPSDKCRSFVGDILEEKDYDRIFELQSNGFIIDSIPKTTSLVAYFPIKTSLSYMIGPMKVYPAFSKYMNEKRYKTTMSIEVYDMPNKTIVFIMQYHK